MYKTIGIIGGVSWESTVLYYQLINKAVRDKFGGLHSAKLIINSLNYAPIVELERKSNWSAVTEILIHASKVLEKAGADYLLLACNTLHKVAFEIEKSISIPFLHIADGAGEQFQMKNINKIGLLGTQFTMEENFYVDRLKDKYGLQVITPDLKARKAIDKIIYDELCIGIINPESSKLIDHVMQSMVQRGAEGILLGCTELGMIVKPKNAPVTTLDTTVLHAEIAAFFAMNG